MLKLENIPPEQMPEIVRVASELQERDLQQDAEAQNRQSTIAAAEEVGLPETYLHQAANELHARRVAQIEQRRQRRTGLMTVGTVVVALGLGGYLVSSIFTSTRFASPQVAASAIAVTPRATVNAPLLQPFNAAQWGLNTSSGTQANVIYENGTAKVTIQKFTPDRSGRYFANLNTKTGIQNLSNYRAATFRAAGTLPYVRLYLENGNERWRSPALAVPAAGEQTLRLDLNQFERQERGRDGISWSKARYQPPAAIENFSFKFGSFVNDANATGTVNLSDLQFE